MSQELNVKDMLFLGTPKALSAIPRTLAGTSVQQLPCNDAEDMAKGLQMQTLGKDFAVYVLVVDLWTLRVGVDSDLNELFGLVPLHKVSLLVIGKPDRSRLAILSAQDERISALERLARIFFWEELSSESRLETFMQNVAEVFKKRSLFENLSLRRESRKGSFFTLPNILLVLLVFGAAVLVMLYIPDLKRLPLERLDIEKKQTYLQVKEQTITKMDEDLRLKEKEVAERLRVAAESEDRLRRGQIARLIDLYPRGISDLADRLLKKREQRAGIIVDSTNSKAAEFVKPLDEEILVLAQHLAEWCKLLEQLREFTVQKAALCKHK